MDVCQMDVVVSECLWCIVIRKQREILKNAGEPKKRQTRIPIGRTAVVKIITKCALDMSVVRYSSLMS